MRIFDISLSIDPGLVVWPGDPKVELERFRSISTGDASNDSRIACSVHSGTHVDAPLHVFDDGPAVDRLPLDALIGPALLVELAQSVDVVTASTLESLRLPENVTRLLFKSRNSAWWDERPGEFRPDFVAIEDDAAGWIVSRRIRLVGVDYLSVEPFRRTGGATHRRLLEAGVIIVEGLTFQNVPAGRYQMVCLPLKLGDSDGAPARAILIED
jgi:arylformamidase